VSFPTVYRKNRPKFTFNDSFYHQHSISIFVSSSYVSITHPAVSVCDSGNVTRDSSCWRVEIRSFMNLLRKRLPMAGRVLKERDVYCSCRTCSVLAAVISISRQLTDVH
jgi:hypothetical protein